MRLANLLIATLVLSAALQGDVYARSKKNGSEAGNARPVPFTLSSPDMNAEGDIAEEQVFNGFGCTGGNTSPTLNWVGAPADTKSFALMVHDPDAPTGGAGWWHWVVINIAANVNTLPKGFGKPENATHASGLRQIQNDFGARAWGGPCPPIGSKPHRYFFTLYALRTDKIEVPVDATASYIGFLVNANAISKTVLKGRYGRPVPVAIPALPNTSPQPEKPN